MALWFDSGCDLEVSGCDLEVSGYNLEAPGYNLEASCLLMPGSSLGWGFAVRSERAKQLNSLFFPLLPVLGLGEQELSLSLISSLTSSERKVPFPFDFPAYPRIHPGNADGGFRRAPPSLCRFSCSSRSRACPQGWIVTSMSPRPSRW